MMKSKAYSLTLCLLLVLLIIFAPTAAEGAERGLVLWFNQVLPVLMPFTLIVQLMLNGPAILWLSQITGPVIQKLFGLSPACSFCILTGFLCGFPMGALTAAQALQQKYIQKEEAQLLAAACNNAGPMFLSSYILDQQLHAGQHRLILMMIFYGSAFLWMWVRSRLLQNQQKAPSVSADTFDAHITGISFRTILLNSSELMLKVGISMMLFGILCEILPLIPHISSLTSSAIALLLEITNGAAAMSQLSVSKITKTVLIMSGTAFGGLCIAFQTYTVICSQKLSFVKYLFDKTAVSLLTGTLTFLWFLLE